MKVKYALVTLLMTVVMFFVLEFSIGPKRANAGNCSLDVLVEEWSCWYAPNLTTADSAAECAAVCSGAGHTTGFCPPSFPAGTPYAINCSYSY